MDRPRYRHNPRQELEDITKQLDAWGRYVFKNVIGLGYPSMSAEHRAFEGGSGGCKGRAFVPIFWYDKISSNTDTAISEMSKDYRKVIFAKFALPYSPHVNGKWSDKLARDFCNMDKTTFQKKTAVAIAHLSAKFGYSI